MLDQATLARFGALLERRRTQLEEEMRAKLASAREVTGSAAIDQIIEGGDYANADLITTVDIAEVQRDVAELRELNTARARLAAGTYGVCVDCGADIALERLQARPTAVRCTDCQARAEARSGATHARL
ncbi:MAG TPA: TraR/DksA C4-type zinc finger protein [Burkholderiales bacterium]|jgi:RNA polymerase-binding protein DksA|nr:TraR/DksA C4-type zinc finger protein [Burkholderiales bacterium]